MVSTAKTLSFFFQHIEVALENNTIRGQLDKSDTGIIFTEAYVKRYSYVTYCLGYLTVFMYMCQII